MEFQLSHWGNSLGLRIPKRLREALSLRSGSWVRMDIREGKLIISPVSPEKMSLSTLVDQITPENQPHLEEDDIYGDEQW